MRTGKRDRDDFAVLADMFGLTPEEVSKAVMSFFDSIVSEARSLPFKNDTVVYSRSLFEQLGSVHQIPFIGRIGPSYTRYKRWKANDMDTSRMTGRKRLIGEMKSEDVERIASDIISGKEPDLSRTGKSIHKDYKKVWYADEDGRRLAWQAIKKKQNI